MARNVTVSTISYGGPGDVADHVRKALDDVSGMVEYASAGRPDVILLPEVFTTLGVSQEKREKKRQGLDGEVVGAGAKWARKHRTHVALPLVLEHRGRATNSVVLLDRRGEIACVYDKMFPTIGEIENGTSPGRGAVVADTDIGRLGFLICYDLNFDELKLQYRQKGAELVLFASMFRGGFITRRWAYDNHCWLAAATPHERSLIVNPLGRVVKESANYERVVTARINLDQVVLHIDYNFPAAHKLRKKYGERVDIEVASPEGIFMLSSNDRRRSARDFVREGEMEPVYEYFDRARSVRERALKRGAARRAKR